MKPMTIIRFNSRYRATLLSTQVSRWCFSERSQACVSQSLRCRFGLGLAGCCAQRQVKWHGGLMITLKFSARPRLTQLTNVDPTWHLTMVGEWVFGAMPSHAALLGVATRLCSLLSVALINETE